jgi:hypothetical protein
MRFLYRRFGRRCVARNRRAERSGKRQRVSRRSAGCWRKTAFADALTKLRLCRTDLGQQLHGIESAVCLAQTALDFGASFGCMSARSYGVAGG